MRLSLRDLNARRPTREDAQQVLDLQIRLDVSEFGEANSDLEDLQHDWQQMDLARDAWLLFTPDGDLVGYGAVMQWVSGLRYDIVNDPHEMNDIAGRKENTAIVKDLSKKLYAWMEAVGDPMLDGAIQSPYYRQSMDAFRKTVQ